MGKEAQGGKRSTPLFKELQPQMDRMHTKYFSPSPQNSYYGGPCLIGPTVQTKTYIFRYFYQQYLVLFTMVPRNSNPG